MLSKGFTKDQIDKLRKFDLKKALLARANESNEKLKTEGYSDSKTLLLKSYAADIETKQESTISPYALTATLYDYEEPYMDDAIENGVNDGRGQGLAIHNQWVWDQEPMITLTDVFAMTWQGMDASGHDVGTQLINSPSDVTYLSTDAEAEQYGAPHLIIEYPDLSIDNFYGNAKYYFSVRKDAYNDQYYAFTGENIMLFVPAGTTPISTINLHIEYGHHEFIGTPSVSFPAGIGINFAPDVQPLGSTTMLMNNSGEILGYSN